MQKVRATRAMVGGLRGRQVLPTSNFEGECVDEKQKGEKRSEARGYIGLSDAGGSLG